MGKKDKTGLGRSLVKDRFGGSNRRKTVDNGSMLHSTVVQDGYDWGRLNLQSVTEESSFQEFLSTAQLANTEFQAEKLNLKLVNINSGVDAITTSDMRAFERKKHLESKHLLRVPRRPKWTREMSADVVQDNERQSFLDWRRDLALLQEKDGLLLTPYEKNLEFWRQLWRVLERSHILIQVVDARNPLLFRCEDLETYAKEVGVQASLILLNKSDLLTEQQRTAWAEYFDKQGIKAAFFSATLEAEKQALNDDIETEANSELNDIDEESESDSDSNSVKKDKSDVSSAIIGEEMETTNTINVKTESETVEDSTNPLENTIWKEKNNTEILDREQLINLLTNIEINTSQQLCVGLVGYPNVGKSSTINCLLNAKKVSVSATPGKTKHFQTLMLDDDLMLCDCPGLVLPSFVCTKADMVVHGILSIDQIKEYMDAVSIVTENLGGRYEAEKRLGILLPPPPPEDSEALPPRDVLNAYAYSRGMMTGNGQPDCARAARVILRAATKGLLPLAIPPPDCDAKEFMSSMHLKVPESEEMQKRRQMTPNEARALKMDETREDLDKKFFGGCSLEAYKKGVVGKFHGLPTDRPLVSQNGEIEVTGKPWKQFNKHVNKNKKQKLRKVYHYLDKH
ncbi:nucleostemin 3 isoform X2 [Arctopsyche grandis]|uniref:nucleostemin 3 isoform X2 n=1 Tax=Arctopsyche grandis TaxID=121162 RepID=UPI00406D6BD6